jgi:hypothetical protein
LVLWSSWLLRNLLRILLKILIKSFLKSFLKTLLKTVLEVLVKILSRSFLNILVLLIGASKARWVLVVVFMVGDALLLVITAQKRKPELVAALSPLSPISSLNNFGKSPCDILHVLERHVPVRQHQRVVTHFMDLVVDEETTQGAVFDLRLPSIRDLCRIRPIGMAIGNFHDFRRSSYSRPYSREAGGRLRIVEARA